jgi:acetylornithine deacetylase/succinyl-diaminopimelate desuccinylase-like protein
MSTAEIRAFVDRIWENEIVPALMEFGRIPNKSAAFDPEWASHGHMQRAVDLLVKWAHAHAIPGMKLDVARIEGRSPLIIIDVPGTGDDRILLYGHLDKQPEMSGWRDGLDPWKPVREGDLLYGRGLADDGYAMFACIAALGALHAAKIPHAPCTIIIEACEESGSFDLPPYIQLLADRIGRPSLVIALDAGCENYKQLWCTTSLRGLAGGTLRVELLTEGIHSGQSGQVADTFRVARHLLDRIENPETGAVSDSAFNVKVPDARLNEIKESVKNMKPGATGLPLLPGVTPVTPDPVERILNSTWRPALSIIGAEGLPPASNAGNVLRPMTALKLSLRLPPRVDAVKANGRLKSLLENNPPYGAKVTFDGDWAAEGWDAPEFSPWLKNSMDEASNSFFGQPVAYMGLGGTIPFMAMLGERFPQAQFLITGVLGPRSNAHGPNEFLHLPTGRNVTCCVAQVIGDHLHRSA